MSVQGSYLAQLSSRRDYCSAMAHAEMSQRFFSRPVKKTSREDHEKEIAKRITPIKRTRKIVGPPKPVSAVVYKSSRSDRAKREKEIKVANAARATGKYGNLVEDITGGDGRPLMYIRADPAFNKTEGDGEPIEIREYGNTDELAIERAMLASTFLHAAKCSLPASHIAQLVSEEPRLIGASAECGRTPAEIIKDMARARATILRSQPTQEEGLMLAVERYRHDLSFKLDCTRPKASSNEYEKTLLSRIRNCSSFRIL